MDVGWRYGGGTSSRTIRREVSNITYLQMFAFTYSPLSIGLRPNGFLGLSLNDRTILYLVIFVA